LSNYLGSLPQETKRFSQTHILWESVLVFDLSSSSSPTPAGRRKVAFGIWHFCLLGVGSILLLFPIFPHFLDGGGFSFLRLQGTATAHERVALNDEEERSKLDRLLTGLQETKNLELPTS
jgi:hypothetical protein